MHWSKLFINILLFVLCGLDSTCSSAIRDNEKHSEWLNINFERFGGNEKHDTNRMAKDVDGNVNILGNMEAKRLIVETDELNSVRRASRSHDNELFVRPQQGIIKPIPKSRELNNLLYRTETQKRELVNGKMGAKETGLRSNYALNRRSSKINSIPDLQSTKFEGDANLGHILNKKRRHYTKILSSHRIAKRNVNTSSPTQPSLTPDPPIIILPPPPVPSFITPPTCNGEKSCAGRCTGNATEFRTDDGLTCYCDAACYEIFNDCCTDFTKYCGVQTPSDISIRNFKWTCEPFSHFKTNQFCLTGDGLWMISRCADSWPDDEIRRNCEHPTTSVRQVSDISRYIPTVNGDLTFRNYFCAKCNHKDANLEYFPVEIKTNVIPPQRYNFSQKVNFLLSYGAEFPMDGPARPKTSHTRRYCLKSIIQSCSGNTKSESCTNGSVALVSKFNQQFKNYDCVLCNDPDGGPSSCFPSFFIFNCRVTQPQKFTLNLDYKGTSNEHESEFTVLSPRCRSGLTFNGKLQECAENFPPPTGEGDKFRILAWFAPPGNSFQFTENDFKTVMKQYFDVEDSHIYNVSIDTVPRMFGLGHFILYHLVGSTILLTPEQSFDVFFKTDSSSNLNLRNFINFEKPLSLTLNNKSYTIIKTTSRPFACVTRKVHTPQEYIVSQNERISVKSTNIGYDKSNYYGQINGNITICEGYVPSYCDKIQTGLQKDDFIINTNLSLHQKNTGILYKLGEYNVYNNSIALCNLKEPDTPTCSNENSCKGRCSNQTEWRTEIKMRCSCDPDCYEVFNDCCTDYTKYCGAQKPVKTLTKKYNYTCEEVGYYDLEYCSVGEGLWMVTQCLREWPYDATRTKCEVPTDKLSYSSPDLYGYLPVLGYDNTTFRNMYCAICNGVQKYVTWPLNIDTAVIPPEVYNITEKVRFLLTHDATFPEEQGPWRPGANQARRYCVKKIVDSCPSGDTTSLCNHGDLTLISVGNFAQYKNTHCAACHGVPKEIFKCFPTKIPRKCNIFFPQSFSLILDNNQDETVVETSVAAYDEKCSRSGMIFDDNLQVCRVNWLSPPEQNGQQRFYVYSWLQPPQNSQNNSFTTIQFQESLAKFLNMPRSQIFDVNITEILKARMNSLLFYLVSSAIALTPQQSLELLSINRSESTTSSETKLLKYLYFSQSFSLQIKGLPYTVAKTTSRPLACVGKITYTPDEYTLQDQERVYIPSTNKTYEQFEYYRENAEQLRVKRGNITVCERFILTQCDGTIVQYTLEEYTIMVNLSIYVNKTSTLYDYGEYEILSNKSVAICQNFKVNIITEARRTIRNDDALGYITFISFLLSILFLIFLLVTYILFPQLRTLPGKNLMNFAASLLLFEIFWLPPNFTEVRSDKPTCEAVAILEHFFLMASFVSMSVIAFHTCKVFARSLPAPKMSQGGERKLFCLYLAFVWLLPGVFVAICVVLDDQDVVKLGYGESEICWLTENNAYTYFVTIPIAVLLLFNIIAFVITAVYLRKHSQNIAAKQASGNRRSNLSIYAKLSTLMGFTWLFGLLALVVTSTTVFWYFFVIFTSLQGVFVAVAFVVNAKTYALYRQGYQKYSNGSSTPNNTTTKRNPTTNIYNDTKL